MRSGMPPLWAWVLVTAAAFLGACSPGPGKKTSSTTAAPDTASAAPPHVLRRGSGGEPGSLDPALAVDTFAFEILRDLYEGLTSEGPDGTIVPGTASTWSVSEGGTRYDFDIRPDAKWSDGTPVRAQDFVRAWRRVVDPATASPVADVLRPIRFAPEILTGKLPPDRLDARAVGESRISIKLSQPTPYFPQLLAHSATFPAREGRTPPGQHPVSNGPYALLRWTPGSDIEIARNPHYWDGNHVSIASVIYRLIANEDAEFSQYRGGLLDITASVPQSALPMIRRDLPGDLQVAPFLGVYYYALNLRADPMKSSLKLRQALAMAVDREQLRSALLPFGQSSAYGFVPPGTSNYEPQSWDWKSIAPAQRTATAQRLYREAGYTPSTRPLHLRLLINSNPAIKRMATAVASMWSQTLGVQTEILDEEYRVFLESRKEPQRWDLIRLGWTADLNDAANFLDTFRSDSANNDSGYHNPAFDRLLDQAAEAPEAAARGTLLESAERMMLADYPVIPIYYYSSKRLISPRVLGEAHNPLNRLYSKHLSLR
jgi:oligopeptide transport system substrate-binding protein